MPEITRDDWLKAVNEAAIEPLMDDPAVLTAKEFAQLIGLEWHSAQKRIEKLLASGKAVRTRKRIRRCDDTVVTVNAYRLTP